MMQFSIICFSANKYWIATTNSNWNTAGNWSVTSGGAGGAAVPGPADIAIFNIAGSGNCQINATVNILGLTINGYAGSINQNAFAISIGNDGFTQSSGTFTGGSSNITLIDGDFYLNGGDFTSTSAILSVGGIQTAGNTVIFNHSAGNFYHNNGRVILNPYIATCSQYTYTIDVIPGTGFYDLEINAPYQTCGVNHIITTGTGDTINVVHDLTLTDGIIKGSFSCRMTWY